jgi:hypothetical protein
MNKHQERKDAIQANPSLEIKTDASRVVNESILIQQPFGDQLLKNKHTLTLGQVFKLALDLKQYFFSELSSKQKLVPFLPPILAMALVAINPHTLVIQGHVGRNMVDDVLLDEGSSANIITKDLKK